MAAPCLQSPAYATGHQPAGQTPAVPTATRQHHYADTNAAHQLGLVHGFGNATYRPAAAVRRDQTASLIIRLLTHLTD